MSKIQTELLIQIIREYRNENINDLPRFTLLYLANEAADEIERLRAEVARLNAFLHPIGVVINEAVRGD